jgi:hypothetical protein
MIAQQQSLGCYTGGNDLLQCALGDMAAAMGGDAVFGLLVGGSVLLTFYVASGGGLATPGVLTALLGGIMIPALPPAYQSIAMTIVLLGLTAALLSGAKKYVMSTGV